MYHVFIQGVYPIGIELKDAKEYVEGGTRGKTLNAPPCAPATHVPLPYATAFILELPN
jgi:hypothetical protein